MDVEDTWGGEGTGGGEAGEGYDNVEGDGRGSVGAEEGEGMGGDWRGGADVVGCGTRLAAASADVVVVVVAGSVAEDSCQSAQTMEGQVEQPPGEVVGLSHAGPN